MASLRFILLVCALLSVERVSSFQLSPHIFVPPSTTTRSSTDGGTTSRKPLYSNTIDDRTDALHEGRGDSTTSSSSRRRYEARRGGYFGGEEYGRSYRSIKDWGRPSSGRGNWDQVYSSDYYDRRYNYGDSLWNRRRGGFYSGTGYYDMYGNGGRGGSFYGSGYGYPGVGYGMGSYYGSGYGYGGLYGYGGGMYGGYGYGGGLYSSGIYGGGMLGRDWYGGERRGRYSSSYYDRDIRSSGTRGSRYRRGLNRNHDYEGGVFGRRRNSYRNTASTSSDTAYSESTVEHVQGGSLKTWSFDYDTERIKVDLDTEGRPLDAEIELWSGPNNSPQKMRVYSEDGYYRPFSAVIETHGAMSWHGSDTIAVRNVASLSFPLTASVEPRSGGSSTARPPSHPIVIDGGALRTFPFDYGFDAVQVWLESNGNPMNARIELWQGPNDEKQIIEIYSEDGFARPFSMVIDTPGPGNVIRVVNSGPLTFPLLASVDPV